MAKTTKQTIKQVEEKAMDQATEQVTEQVTEQKVVKATKEASTAFSVKGIRVVRTETQLSFINEEGVLVTVDRQMGKSDYHTAKAAIERKGTGRRADGRKGVGNFSYELSEDNTLTVFNKLGEIIKIKHLSDKEAIYPRNAAINVIITHFE